MYGEKGVPPETPTASDAVRICRKKRRQCTSGLNKSGRPGVELKETNFSPSKGESGGEVQLKEDLTSLGGQTGGEGLISEHNPRVQKGSGTPGLPHLAS